MRVLSDPVTTLVISPSYSNSFKCLARILADIPGASLFNSPKRLDSPVRRWCRIRPFHFPPIRFKVSSAGQVNFFNTIFLLFRFSPYASRDRKASRFYKATAVPMKVDMLFMTIEGKGQWTARGIPGGVFHFRAGRFQNRPEKTCLLSLSGSDPCILP